ncbi:MAG TPA: hypothetical protein VJV74_03995 [Terriglobia bacterium]|nr:hypothetical protein [Terriglobia bacterium]
MHFIVIGNIGSDAGYWVWDGHEWKHVGGWGVEQLAEVTAALNIMRESTRFKTPGMAAAATKTVAEFAQKQLGAHLKEGGSVVVIA